MQNVALLILIIVSLTACSQLTGNQDNLWTSNTQEYSMINTDENEDAIVARTIDGYEVGLEVTIIYHINADDMELVRTRWSESAGGYELALIRPMTRSTVRDVVATYLLNDLIGEMTAQQEFEDEIELNLVECFGDEGFTVDDFIVNDIIYEEN